MSRYKDRLHTIEGLQREVITLQHLLNNRSRQLRLSDVINISNTYSGITLSINAVECWIDTDRKAKWITESDAEELTELLNEVKSIINMLM